MIDVVRRTAGGKLKLIRRLAENVYSWIYIMDNLSPFCTVRDLIS